MRLPFCLAVLLISASQRSLVPVEGAARFLVTGPVVTLTLKDPTPPSIKNNNFDESTSTTNNNKSPFSMLPWLDLSALSPTVFWQIASSRPPLPNWFPNLQKLALKTGYQHSLRKRSNKPHFPRPSFVEGTAQFRTPACDIVVQPSHDLDSGSTSVAVEASRGPNWILGRLAHRRSNNHIATGSAAAYSSSPRGNLLSSSWFLDSLQGSLLLNLPYASVSSVCIQPTLNLPRQELSCQLEALTGLRTKAVLNLEWNHPTLTIVHQVDARHSMAPTIHLYSAKMTYQWNMMLRAGSSLVTRVDPTR
jgi:hypothetical protein